MTNSNKRIFFCIQLATVAVFLGRGWQHLFWDAPFRSVLWDEDWMKGIVRIIFGMDWNTYITSAEVDQKIDGLIKGTGIFYMLCALLSIFIKKIPPVLKKILLIGAISLVLLAFGYYKEKFFSIGQFFEYTLQFSAPVILYYLANGGAITDKFKLFIKIAIALTFTCHGLYAFGIYPLPETFVTMTINILGVEESTAMILLKGMGILDFVVSILIFLPKKWTIMALKYAVVWGFLTAFARMVAYFNFDFMWDALTQNWFETIYRIPHFMIPLALLLILKNDSENIVL